MTNQFLNVGGHIEVYDASGEFLFSADTMEEAWRELCARMFVQHPLCFYRQKNKMRLCRLCPLMNLGFRRWAVILFFRSGAEQKGDS